MACFRSSLERPWLSTKTSTARPPIEREGSGRALCPGHGGATGRLHRRHPETGWWAGIEVVDRATVTLRHCKIAYGGATMHNLSASLVIRWGCPAVRRCRHPKLRDRPLRQKRDPLRLCQFSGHVPADLPTTTASTTTPRKAVANWNAPALDARNNWWGDASGPYHPTLNPVRPGRQCGRQYHLLSLAGRAGDGRRSPPARCW